MAKNNPLRSIVRMTTNVVGTRPLKEQLVDFAAEVASVFQVEGCVIRLIEGDHLVLLACAGIPEGILQKEIKSNWGISKEILSGQKPVLIKDTRTDPRTADWFRALTHDYQFISYAGAPLIAGNEVIGLVGVYSERKPRKFRELDLEYLQLVANHIAVNILNDRLYQNLAGKNLILAQQRSELRRARKRLAESEREYRLLFDCNPQPMWVCDFETLAIRAVNEAAIRQYGYSHKEFLRMNLGILFSEMDAGWKPLRWKRHRIEPALSAIHRRKSGSRIYVEFYSSHIQFLGQKAVLVMAENVTRRKQAEKKLKEINSDLESRVLQRTAELQETIRSLDGICYHVAHDLRAPLRAMQGFTQALTEDYAPMLDETGRDYAARIQSGAKRMDDLIHDLLEYGRLGHMELNLTSVDVNHQLDCAMATLGEQIRSSKAIVKVCKPLPSVRGYPTLVNQILMNLLHNALKFVPPGKIPEVVIRSEANRRLVRLWFEDNGIGIDPQHQQRIFKIFERLHSVDTYSGTGMGLAIVQKGVQRQGGKTGVESELGRGSRFWIELQKA